jgi:hypothetical protein
VNAAEAGVTTTRTGTSRTQRVTAKDIQAGRIRIPSTGNAKSLLPRERGRVEVVLRGQRLSSRYDPGFGPDKQRSGVLSIPRAVLSQAVTSDEVLTMVVDPSGVVALD